MIYSAYSTVMSYKTFVTYGDASPILKSAPHIYKSVFTYGDVLAAVGIERREHTETAVERLTGQVGHYISDLIGSMIAAVQL